MNNHDTLATHWGGISRLHKIVAALLALALLLSLFPAVRSLLGCGTAAVADPVAAAVTAPAVVAAVAPAAAVTAPAAAVVASPAAALAVPPNAKVYFDVNKYAPPSDIAQQLDALVVYARSGPNTKLSIAGYHDKTGDPVKNVQLAKDRAASVKNALVSAGIPEDRLVMQKPTELGGNAGNDKEARRVEISVVQ